MLDRAESLQESGSAFSRDLAASVRTLQNRLHGTRGMLSRRLQTLEPEAGAAVDKIEEASLRRAFGLCENPYVCSAAVLTVVVVGFMMKGLQTLDARKGVKEKNI